LRWREIPAGVRARGLLGPRPHPASEMSWCSRASAGDQGRRLRELEVAYFVPCLAAVVLRLDPAITLAGGGPQTVQLGDLNTPRLSESDRRSQCVGDQRHAVRRTPSIAPRILVSGPMRWLPASSLERSSQATGGPRTCATRCRPRTAGPAEQGPARAGSMVCEVEALLGSLAQDRNVEDRAGPSICTIPDSTPLPSSAAEPPTTPSQPTMAASIICPSPKPTTREITPL